MKLFGKQTNTPVARDATADLSLIRCSDAEFVEVCYRLLLQRNPDCPGMSNYLLALRRGTSRLEIVDAFINSSEFRQRTARLEYAPSGHFYSPIPAREDIEKHRAPDADLTELPAIELRLGDQKRLLEQFRSIYPTIPFTDSARPGFRYQYLNPTYSYGDGILTHCMIRTFRPRRIIEVGSGNSSCLILDTSERFFEGRIECTFIDPHPQYFQSLIGPEAAARTTIIESRLQEADLTLFDQLEANDILFIDSTHVSKLDSDVNRYLFAIFPRLKPGVLIHIHDVAWPFEYSLEWLQEGRAWNEQYLLRAFLMYNPCFSIRLFTTLLFRVCREWFQTHMPLCLKEPGGSIWIQHVGQPQASNPSET
jgi:predicted O-methyltransferase YrrM